jgi:MinD-like ATPase involved in chromosome partitioning or flagellar assembly
LKRINFFVGNYGSGKTEIAINASLRLKQQFPEVILADIDIVNPYFRSSEHKAYLEERGIKVLMPQYANTGVDLPTLPLDIYSVFIGNAHVILDCGGDPAGATALGALKKHIEKIEDDMEVYFVLNACRPRQATLEQTLEMVKVIEHVSRIKVTGIINNTNIANETTAKELAMGQEIAQKTADALHLPLSYISGKKEVLEAYAKTDPAAKEKFFPIDIFMRPYWLDT